MKGEKIIKSLFNDLSLVSNFYLHDYFDLNQFCSSRNLNLGQTIKYFSRWCSSMSNFSLESLIHHICTSLSSANHFVCWVWVKEKNRISVIHGYLNGRGPEIDPNGLISSLKNLTQFLALLSWSEKVNCWSEFDDNQSPDF